MRISFYTYQKSNPNALVGTATLENGRLSFSKSVESFVKDLLQGMDTVDILNVEQALRKADQVYDGLYLRAEVIG